MPMQLARKSDSAANLNLLPAGSRVPDRRGITSSQSFQKGEYQFFRDSRSDDISSTCTASGREVGLQLDPDIEVICLWMDSTFTEIGSWASDPVADAVAWLTVRSIDT